MKKTINIAKYATISKMVHVQEAERYIFSLDSLYSCIVKKKEELVQGDILATGRLGNLFAPCDAVVESVSEKEIVLIPQAVSKEPRNPIDFLMLTLEEQLAILHENGISSLWKNTKTVQVCLINALPVDAVKVHYMPSLFEEELPALQKGIDIIRVMYPNARIKYVMPSDAQYHLDNAEKVFYDKPYPYTLTPLVKNTLEGSSAIGVMTLSLMDIWKIGSIALSGKSLAKTIFVCNEHVVSAPLGLPLATLFEHLKIDMSQVSAGVVNGVMNGVPLCSLLGGVMPSLFSLHTFQKHEIPLITEDPCVSCGYCTAICPVGIKVHLLNQYAQQTLFDACEEEHIDICVECGMCDYVCITKRPIMQYIRNAKEHNKNLLPMG